MSRMWQAVLPLLAVVIPAVVGVWMWSGELAAERKQHERLRKEQLYTGLTDALAIMDSRGTGAGLVVESQRAWLYASDDVLIATAAYTEKLLEYEDHLADLSPEEEAALHEAAGKIHLAIRNDLRSNAKTQTPINDAWVEEKWKRIGACLPEVKEYLQQTRQIRQPLRD